MNSSEQRHFLNFHVFIEEIKTNTLQNRPSFFIFFTEIHQSKARFSDLVSFTWNADEAGENFEILHSLNPFPKALDQNPHRKNHQSLRII
jgi:hypothetical protein